MSLVGASLIGVFASQEVALGEPAGAEVTDGTVKKYPGREVVISVLVAYGSGSSPPKGPAPAGPFRPRLPSRSSWSGRYTTTTPTPSSS